MQKREENPKKTEDVSSFYNNQVDVLQANKDNYTTQEYTFLINQLRSDILKALFLI